MLVLRPYQDALVERLRDAYRNGKQNPVLVLATGGGKTVIAAGLARLTQAKGRTVWFICHRDFLIEQTSLTFKAAGVPHGFLAAGRPVGMAPTMIVAIDTLRSRLGKLSDAYAPDVMVWDECHHVMAAGWQKVWAWARDCFHIGLTATPERLDGKGLGGAPGKPGFQTIILGPTVAELMSWGNLSQYACWSSLVPDLKGVRTLAGDYNQGDLAKRVSDTVITGDIIEHYVTRARGKRAIYFCVDVAYSQRLAADFNSHGIPAEHVDGELNTEQRIAAAKRFAKGETLVLTNCALLGEGYDLAAQAGMDVTVEAVGLVRPTQSKALHLQQMGRALRPKDSPAIILDHAGNVHKHGLPDTARQWSLDGRQKLQADALVQCPHCLAMNRATRATCSACGQPLRVPEERRERAGPEHLDGQLVQVNGAMITVQELHSRRVRWKQLVAQAHTYEDFVRVGRYLGYKPGWAWVAHKSYSQNRRRA